MSASIKASDLPARVRQALPKARGRTEHRPTRGMNKLEAAYAQLLEVERKAGLLLRWDYEPERLKLAEGSYYTPDFRVQLADGTIEFHETKGFMREAAAVRLKAASALHPYTFRLVKRSGGAWTVLEV